MLVTFPVGFNTSTTQKIKGDSKNRFIYSLLPHSPPSPSDPAQNINQSIFLYDTYKNKIYKHYYTLPQWEWDSLDSIDDKISIQNLRIFYFNEQQKKFLAFNRHLGDSKIRFVLLEIDGDNRLVEILMPSVEGGPGSGFEMNLWVDGGGD